MYVTTHKKAAFAEDFRITVDSEEVCSGIESALDAIGKQAKAAVRRALRRTFVGVRKLVVDEVRKEYNVKAGTVRQTMSLRISDLDAVIKSSGRVIPLRDFGARPASPSPGRRTPVTVEVKKGQRKPVLPDSRRKGFVARMATGHVGVFRRRGDDQTPIDELYTLSVPQMIGGGGEAGSSYDSPVVDALYDYAGLRFPRELEHEVQRILGGRG